MSIFSKMLEAVTVDRKVWPLLAMICSTMIGAAMVVPMLSLYAQTFGVSATLVGMLVTIFGIGRIVANFPSGWLSQRLGRRPLLAAGPAIVAVGAIGAAVTEDFAWLLFWRFVQGVGSGMYQTVSLAALADISTPQTRGRLVGLYQASLQFGASIGPLIGGYVAQWFGLAAPFWLLLVISIVTLVLAITSFRDVDVKQVRTMTGTFGKRRGLMTAPFLAISLVSAITFFARTAFMFQLVPLMGNSTFGLQVGALGLAVTIIAFTMLLVIPAAGVMVDRFGARIVVIFSMLLAMAGIGLILGGTHQAWFWASMTVYGIASGISSPAVGAYTIEVLPRHKYGEGMGLQRTISDIGYVLGPIVAGFVTDISSWGLAAGTVTTAALVGLVTLLFILATIKRPAG